MSNAVAIAPESNAVAIAPASRRMPHGTMMPQSPHARGIGPRPASKAGMTPHFDSNLTEHEKNVRLRNRDRAIMPLSVTTDEDMEVWLQWLQEAVADHLPDC